MVAQVFEQLLAVLAPFEVVFAQDQVERFQAEVLDRVAGASGVVDFLQSTQREHIGDGGAHAGVRLDDQCGESVKFIHFLGIQSNFWAVLRSLRALTARVMICTVYYDREK